MGQPFSLATLLDTVNNHFLSICFKYCMMYLTPLCNLYQDMFLLYKAVNVQFITSHLHSIRHRAWVRTCMHDMWVLTIYCRLHNMKWQIPVPLTIYYLGQKEENYMLNCVRRSEVCSMAQKSHSKKMHGLGVFSVKKCVVWYMVGDDKISLEDLRLLR